MLKFVSILALSIGIIQYASAVCHACNEKNNVACVSEKEFYLCYGGVADKSQKFSCLGQNEICTKNAKACMDTTLEVVAPACGDTSNCGKCGIDPEDEGMITCTSRTTFTICFGGELTDIRSTCPENQICDITLGKQKKNPCVPACKEPEIEFCDLYDAIDEPITTTQEPTTTEQITTTTATTENISNTTEHITTTTIFAPTPPPVTTTTEQVTTTELSKTTQNPAELVCSEKTFAGRYPYPNDTTCKKYIYCFKKNGAMQTTFLKCPNQFYFNPSTSLCGEVKPQGCI